MNAKRSELWTTVSDTVQRTDAIVQEKQHVGLLRNQTNSARKACTNIGNAFS